MKLRNKKTGKRGDYLIETEGDVLNVRNYYNDYEFYQYFSITKFNKEWEDYKSAEPLIKDEKIRKAVRAWAEAIGVDELFYCIDYRTKRAVFSWSGNDMTMELLEPVEGLAVGRVYTIEELCGEEQE